MDELRSPIFRPFEQQTKLLPEIKLSEMTHTEKLKFIRDGCYDIAYDMTSGQLQEQMNDEWYGKLLAVMKDCGFDTASIENVDWNNIKEIVPGCNKICNDVENALRRIPRNKWGKTIWPDQIIIDN